PVLQAFLQFCRRKNRLGVNSGVNKTRPAVRCQFRCQFLAATCGQIGATLKLARCLNSNPPAAPWRRATSSKTSLSASPAAAFRKPLTPPNSIACAPFTDRARCALQTLELTSHAWDARGHARAVEHAVDRLVERKARDPDGFDDATKI